MIKLFTAQILRDNKDLFRIYKILSSVSIQYYCKTVGKINYSASFDCDLMLKGSIIS